MKCPNCHKIVENLSRCSNCRWPFYAPIDTPLPSQPVGEALKDFIQLPSGQLLHVDYGKLTLTMIPLTRAQKKYYLSMIGVSIALLLLILTFIGLLISAGDGGIFIVFIDIIGLLVAWMLLIHSLDLVRGLAQIYVDRLIDIEIYQAKYNNRSYCFGYFERLGRVELPRHYYKTAVKGMVYRLTYGLNIRRLLDMEQVASLAE